MIALFSALLGFISSAVPDFIKIFREEKDRAHEITLLKLQMDYDREKLAANAEEYSEARAVRLHEIEMQAATAEQTALQQWLAVSRRCLSLGLRTRAHRRRDASSAAPS